MSLSTSIGIDFGGTFVKMGVTRGGEIIHRAEPIPTGHYQGAVALIDAMAKQVELFKAEFNDITSLGIGVPGLVDFDKGYIHELTNVPGWKHIPLKTLLQEKTGLPTLVENDANAMTYAEYRYGAGKGMKNVVGITLGTGVGGGFVIDGKMYRGKCFTAGEIGQMSIDYRGVPGNFGNLGALEKYAGNAQITEHAIQCYAAAGIIKSAEECQPKDLAAAALKDDMIAKQVWEDLADWLGTALSSIAWLLNPDAFVIGGGVAQAGPLIFKPLQAKVQAMLSPVIWQNTQILPAMFSNDAGIIGNSALAEDALTHH
jgi:glucokinase